MVLRLALFILNFHEVGEEVQRLSVIQSIPDLLAINSTECIEKIVPKMQQALPTGSTEYHMLASQTIKTVIQKNLIPMDTFIETFLHPILASMDNRDPRLETVFFWVFEEGPDGADVNISDHCMTIRSMYEDRVIISHRVVSNAWIETMMDILDFLPDSVIQSQITPVALARTQGMKSIPFRMSNIRLLGSIAKRYDSTSDTNYDSHGTAEDGDYPKPVQIGELEARDYRPQIKRDLLPSIISLCQDCNYEVRACMCLQLPGVAERLGDDATKSNLLPALIELATDDTSSVKEATLTTIVSTLHVFNILKTTLVPMLKQMVIFSLKYDTSLMTTMASLFGKMCLGIEQSHIFTVSFVSSSLEKCFPPQEFIQFGERLEPQHQVLRVLNPGNRAGAVPSQEKDAYVKWYSAFAQLGAHSKKSARSSDVSLTSFFHNFVPPLLRDKECCGGVLLDVAQAFDRVWHPGLLFKLKNMISQRDKISKYIPIMASYHSNSFADAYALCRQYCAYNFPAMACFCRNDANLLTKSLHVIFYDLTLDTYYMVRKTIACGLHEVIYLYTKNCAILKPDFLRLLKDESEDVLEGLIPNITECLSHFVRNGVFGHALMDPSTSELVRSLMKCESVIAGTHNWRLHTTLFEQFECLYSVLPSDILFANFVTLLFNRAVPTRLAVVKTLLVILRYLPKAQQRSEIRNRIINDLCMSRSFYDRMMFVRSCDVMFDKFSTTYFKEHFFVKTVSLTEDPVANVRWATACLLPKLKAMARLPGDVRLQQLVEAAVERLSVDPDPEVLRKMEEVKQQMDKVEFGKVSNLNINK
ncbi:hypothetical protein AAG570_003357 [Ranatra chinensis]|uniref:Phosphatase PP2A regulatory subunit A/Splicing factor 3B subunit 1-like HEAT repeat domain-containing protein n=1 Tax=Ranatra chinensis TaxID=642074 RepID=A0ABD0YS02_9HEMI